MTESEVRRLLGALAGAWCVRLLLPPAAGELAVYGAPSLGASVTLMKGIWIEALLTFFLVSTVFGAAAATDAPAAGGFAIGLTVFVGALVAGPLTGAALNPARAFGPELISGSWSDAWLYWIGPLIGGALGAGVYAVLYLDRPIDVIGRPGTGVDEEGVERAT